MIFRNLAIIFILFSFSLFAEDYARPKNFDFTNPETFIGKLSIKYHDQITYYSKTDFEIIPMSWEVSNEDQIVISFSSVTESGGSWYTRDFTYLEDEDCYIFRIFQYGGRTREMKFIHNEPNIECYVMTSGIWVDDPTWEYVGRVIFLLDNYQP